MYEDAHLEMQYEDKYAIESDYESYEDDYSYLGDCDRCGEECMCGETLEVAGGKLVCVYCATPEELAAY